MGLNKMMMIGNLGRDVELKYTANGKAVATFSIAVNEGSGEKARTEWVSVQVWDKLAEVCAQHLAQGRQVYVEGRMQTRSWEDKEGKQRSEIRIETQEVKFAESKREAAGDDDRPGEKPAAVPAAKPATRDDDDLPV